MTYVVVVAARDFIFYSWISVEGPNFINHFSIAGDLACYSALYYYHYYYYYIRPVVSGGG